MTPRLKIKKTGFTLVELLIVIAVIAILASIAIPTLVSSRKAANEGSAIQSLRTVASCEEAYRQRQNPPVYASSLNTLLTSGGMDASLAAGSKSGYTFGITAASAGSYSATAAPATPGTSGDRYFFVDQTGVIRQNSGSAADASSSPLG